MCSFIYLFTEKRKRQVVCLIRLRIGVGRKDREEELDGGTYRKKRELDDGENIVWLATLRTMCRYKDYFVLHEVGIC